MSGVNRCIPLCIACMIFLSAFLSCSEDAIEPDTTAPTIEITYPASSAVVSGQTMISAEAGDNRGISVVQFFVGDEMIAEDRSEPYEQTWYAGYWNPGWDYDLTAVAIDRRGNKGISAPVTVALEEGSRFIPELLNPEDGEEVDLPYDLPFAWRPVPGARAYVIRFRTSDFNFMQYYCTSGGYGECFVNVQDTLFAGPLQPDRAPPIDWTAEGYWRVRAYWSVDYLSEWSEERHVRFK